MKYAYGTLSALAAWELFRAETIEERWTIARTALPKEPLGIWPKLEAIERVIDATGIRDAPSGSSGDYDIEGWPRDVLATGVCTLDELRRVYSWADVQLMLEARSKALEALRPPDS